MKADVIRGRIICNECILCNVIAFINSPESNHENILDPTKGKAAIIDAITLNPQ